MSGGFLGVSLSSAFKLPFAAADRLRSIDSDLIGPRRQQWGDVTPGANLLVSWTRESGIGATIVEEPTATRIVTGVTGVFSGIQRGNDGIKAWCDPLGYGSLFHWSTSGLSAVSTRPELIAEVAAAVGRPLVKRADAIADLAYVGWLGNTMTGWEEVHAIPAGGSIRMANGTSRVVIHDGQNRWAHEPPERRALDDLIEDAADALTESLRTVLDTTHPLVADLTAGTDSRLVVAGLAALGALDHVDVQTVGLPGLADVDTAARLAEFLGARHRTGLPYPFSMDEFGAQLERHVTNTCGMSNPMDGIRDQPGPVDEIRISGLIGEVVSGWPTHVPREASTRDSLDKIARAFQAARLDLLQPDPAEHARARLDDYLLAPPHAELPGWFSAHRYYGEVRLRGRLSRVDDFTPEVRAYPLYSRRLIEAGIACLWHHPEADLLALLTDRLAPGLNAAATASPAGAASATVAKPASFMQTVLAAQADSRREVFAAIASRDSAAWEIIDRHRFRTAIDNYDTLKNPQLRLLHGAAAAVLWMADRRA